MSVIGVFRIGLNDDDDCEELLAAIERGDIDAILQQETLREMQGMSLFVLFF